MLPARYQEITSTLVPGGFGHVRRVRDKYLNRIVLLKAMQDKAHNAQLLSEIQALSKARSRHVVDIYDVIFDTDGTVDGIIIELLEGGEFDEFHKEVFATPYEYLRVLFQIACALTDLHRAGIVHRDLKLDNFRESTARILKLFDFGISTIDDGIYRTTNNRGTPIYAAPELFQATPLVTSKMDIYAFGVCAWALATDKCPSVLAEQPPQQSGSAPSIDVLKPGWLPGTIVLMIDLSLNVDPANRPTAEQIKNVLEIHLTQGQHKGLFIQDSQNIFELSSKSPFVKIKIGALGEIRVDYDGFVFRITQVSGDVFVNNVAVVVGMELHDACVLTFGAEILGNRRSWLTFSASHPEVVL